MSYSGQAPGDGGGTPLTVKEADGTPTVADVDTIVVTNGTLTDDGGGQVSLITGGGGGGGAHQVDDTATHTDYLGATLYLPDWPPSSAGAGDDEFADNSAGVPSGWTEWDVGARLTVAEGEDGTKMTWAGDFSELSGMRKAIPAGDFSLITKISLSATGNFEGGIFLAEDLAANPSTADVQTLMMRYDGGMLFSIAAQRWSAYNSLLSTNFFTSSRTHGGTIYLRWRRISTNLHADYSFDGLSWLRMGAAFAEPFTIAHVVLGGAARNSDGGTAYFRFYRETTSTAIAQPLLGRRVKVAAST
jgi:hypothetical protein